MLKLTEKRKESSRDSSVFKTFSKCLFRLASYHAHTRFLISNAFISNTRLKLATFEAQFIKTLRNTGGKLEKCVAYKEKSVCQNCKNIQINKFNLLLKKEIEKFWHVKSRSQQLSSVQ